jgi:hypothetical protein
VFLSLHQLDGTIFYFPSSVCIPLDEDGRHHYVHNRSTDRSLLAPFYDKIENQFRALDEDEISFLDSLVDDNNEEDLKSAQEVKNQLATFRQ